jgi:hypothetical protein
MVRTGQERIVVMRQLPAGSMYLEPCCVRAAGRVSTAAENANLAAEDVVELLIGHSASLGPTSCFVSRLACAKAP